MMDHVFIEVQEKGAAFIRTDRRGKTMIASDDDRVIFDRRFDPYFVLVCHRVDRVRVAPYADLFERATSWFDLSQLVVPLAFHQVIASRELDSICAHFEVKREQPGPADDCVAIMVCYWRLMNRYRLLLKGEEWAREAGGDTFKTIQRLFNF